jgi:type I restriction enzyme M protein
MLRYCKLWHNFGEKEFTHAQADQALAGDKTTLSVILSQIRKAGWLETRLDENDGRKRKYRLIPPTKIINNLGETS